MISILKYHLFAYMAVLGLCCCEGFTLHLQVDSFITEPPGKPHKYMFNFIGNCQIISQNGYIILYFYLQNMKSLEFFF